MSQKCECDEDARQNMNPQSLYKPEEYKAIRHAPNECPGDFGLQLYKRPDGSTKWLCSCCNLTGDIPVESPRTEEKE